MTVRLPLDPGAAESSVAALLRELTPQSLEREATALPRALYASPEVYQLEQARIFGRAWFYAAHVSEIPAPGAYLALTIAGQPLLLVRDEEGTLRGFFNVCPHRAAPLAEGSGSCKRLVCRYHAWSFDLQGKLRGAPDMRGAEGFDRDAHGLAPVQVQAWGPFVFVNLSPEAGPLGDQLGDLAGMFDRYALSGWTRAHSIDYFVDANWKLYQENVSESYHEPILHASTWSHNYAYEPTRPVARDHYYLHHSPLPEHGPRDLLSGAAEGLCAAGLDEDERRRMTVIFLFPNLGWALTPTYQVTVLIDPMGPRRTRVRMDWLLPPVAGPRDPEDLAALVRFFDQVQKEDLELLPAIQAGIESLGYRRGRLSPGREMGVHRMQHLAMDYLTGRR